MNKKKLKNSEKIIFLLLMIIILMLCASIIYQYFFKGENKEENIIKDNIIENELTQSSTEIPNLTEIDEQTVEYQETENEGFEEQGEIAYEGAEKTPNINLGKYEGLTYYLQTDKRWKEHVYTAIGDNRQTVGTSGCGPTAAAMVVSSIKGNITPDKMADLYVQYGYRSANQGTYWSAFKWTADVFNIEYSECYKLDDAIEKLKNNNYIIASCNQGLFTYGGHFVVLIGIEGDYIKVYDPYLYNGKFEVSSRKGKVDVKGNTVYVSIENFRNYANYRKFFCFKNDKKANDGNETESNSNEYIKTNYQVMVTPNIGLNIRSGAGISYGKIGTYTKGTNVTIVAESNGWGKTDKGWILLSYTTKNSSSLDIENNNANYINNTVGQTRKLANNCNLYSNSNLSGYRYSYLPNTTVTILENIAKNIDKVRVNATGRIAYINTSNYSIYSYKNSNIRKTKNCTLYSKSNLSGIRYQYKSNTTVTILQHINSYIDKVRVNATGRIAYININNYQN